MSSSNSSAGIIVTIPPAVRIERPAPSEYQPYFRKYIGLIEGDDVGDCLREQIDEVREMFADLDDATSNEVHPPYTWSLREVLGHLIDTERVFGYRAARFASGDPTPLPGYDETVMVAGSRYKLRSPRNLFQEWACLRFANLGMFASWNEQQWTASGVADGKELSVRAAAWVIAGHTSHHLQIVGLRLEGIRSE